MVHWESIEVLSAAEKTIDLDAASILTDITDEDTISALTEPKFDDFIEAQPKNNQKIEGCTAKTTSDLVTETIQDANAAIGAFLTSINSPPFNIQHRLHNAASTVQTTASKVSTSVKSSVKNKMAERQERKREQARLMELEEERRMERRRIKYMASVRDECTDVANLWRVK
jgi:hypothetical protein